MNHTSELYLNSKLAKDLSTLYDKIVGMYPEIRDMALVHKILLALGIFKELKSSIVESTSTMHSSLTKELQQWALSKFPLERLQAETTCLHLIWTALSSGSHEITKNLIVNFISSLFALNDPQDSAESIKELLQLPNLEAVDNIGTLIRLLGRGVNVRENLKEFAGAYRAQRTSTEDEEVSRCTFRPNVGKGIVKRLKGVSSSRAKTRGGRSFEAGRSESPGIHEELYADYARRKNSLKVLETKVDVKRSKEYTFRPKVSPMSEKYKRNPNDLVTPP